MAEQKDFIDELFENTDKAIKMENLAVAHTVSAEMRTGILKLKANLVACGGDDEILTAIDATCILLGQLNNACYRAWNELIDGDES